MSSYYTETWYARKREGTLRAAQIVVPLVMEDVAPGSMIDVGCGAGEWMLAFERAGVRRVLGVDGGHVQESALVVPRESFVTADLNQELLLDESFDLAVCLEVGEHLRPESAPVLVRGLTRLSPVVLFSAAIPYQGGSGHINEQWPSYWASLFAAAGYIPVDELRQRLWSNAHIPLYYKQNIMYFVRSNAIGSYFRLAAAAEHTLREDLDRVHPELYLKRLVPYIALLRAASLLPHGLRKGLFGRARSMGRRFYRGSAPPSEL